MRLPPDTVIATEKVTGYLLRWREEDDKSAFLAGAGYTLENAERLRTDIREQLMTREAEFVEQTEYGPKYRIRGALTGPNGRALRVVTIWMEDEAAGKMKFLTLYPEKI